MDSKRSWLEMWARLAVCACLLGAPAGAQCELRLTPGADYKFLIASFPEGTRPGPARWLRNGEVWRDDAPAQTFLLHADEGLRSSEGAGPLIERGVSFAAGRWGSAIFLEAGGQLAYARAPHFPLAEGTIEMWIAAREHGASATYTKDNELFRYAATNGEYLRVAQAGRDGTLYLGGSSQGQWQSAYGSRASMRTWAAGEWHHIAATYSATENSMRFYVDGVKTADTNEKHYWPPAETGERFTLGSTAFVIDEVRFSSRSLSEEEVRARAAWRMQPANGETWLPIGEMQPGESVAIESGDCRSAPFVYRGIPITAVEPDSTVLPPGTAELELVVRTAEATSCRVAFESAFPFEEMSEFAAGAGTTEHRTRITGLSPDANTVNEVFVRCANAPEYLRTLLYRSRAAVNPSFPRIGNLWGSGGKLYKGHEYAAKIKAYFGAEMTASDIRRLRELNPEILVLTSINTVENRGLPEDYYLHDTRGNKIEVWPGTYRLNLTKPYVAEYQARFAHQKMLDSRMMYDGVFFDNFFTSQSWLKADIHGTPVELDANEDGKPDDPRWLDEEWRKGVFYELSIWRNLMPHALASGHLPRPVPAEVGEIFNGSGILFISTNVIDGRAVFSDLWDSYHRWWKLGREPVITAIEASPANQLAYGYGYRIASDMPLRTQEFGRTQYRYMRFALALALMNDGYFWHDFGDTQHGTDWWYDEYDFGLGHPEGPAELFDRDVTPGANLVANGGFEDPLEGTWGLTISGTAGAAATLARDIDSAEGFNSALITVTNVGQGVNWHVDFNQRNRALTKGVNYEFTFQAKSDAARDIQLSSQKGAPDWRNYGLSGSVALTTEWKRHSVVFTANETVTDSRIQFFLGARTGKVWLDDVRLVEQPDQLYLRKFTKGAVLLNGSLKRLTVAMPDGYRRFVGNEAPRHQYVVDDDSAQFRSAGAWKEAVFDTGQWKSRGPYYHNWGRSCRKLEAGDGVAEWDLSIPEDGTYTIEAWWAAAPEQREWSRSVVYEVVAGGKVVATATLDQTAPGDQWYRVAEVDLKAQDQPFVRLRNGGSAALIADALHVWSAARYNDGSPARAVAIEPLDGILLQKENKNGDNAAKLP